MEVWTLEDVEFVRNGLQMVGNLLAGLFVVAVAACGWAIVGRLTRRGNNWGLDRRDD